MKLIYPALRSSFVSGTIDTKNTNLHISWSGADTELLKRDLTSTADRLTLCADPDALFDDLPDAAD